MNAQTLLGLFYTAENGNICIKSDEPDTEAVKSMVFAADESGLGWDFAYEAVRDCLQHLAESGESPDDADPDAANLLDIYVSDLVQWLAKYAVKHVALCDEAAEEMFGYADSMEEIIRNGQHLAYRYAFEAIAANWIDEEEEESD